MTATARALTVVVAFALALATATAAAQDAGTAVQDPRDEAQAEALVLEARTAVEQARLADARRLLERAFELAPTPAVGFNLGLVLRDLGELVAARAMFERIRSGELGELPDDRRARVDELLREVSAGVAAVMVVVTGPERAEVRLDGEVVGTAVEGETLRLSTDPGEHVVLATAPGFAAADQRLSLARGEARRVDLTLDSIVAPSAVDGGAAPPSGGTIEVGADDGSVLASPWLWTGVLLAIGAAVAVVILVASGGDDADGQMLPPAPDGFLATITTP